MDEHILVPYDGSPASRAALSYAVARFPGSVITLLYVMEPMTEYARQRAFPGYTGPDEFGSEREKGEYLLDAATEDLGDVVEVDTQLIAGTPAREIIEFADEHGIDHVVIGSHGRSSVSRFLLGSTAETVIRRSEVPVTVVRPEA